jgi:hypothetical protein
MVGHGRLVSHALDAMDASPKSSDNSAKLSSRKARASFHESIIVQGRSGDWAAGRDRIALLAEHLGSQNSDVVRVVGREILAGPRRLGPQVSPRSFGALHKALNVRPPLRHPFVDVQSARVVARGLIASHVDSPLNEMIGRLDSGDRPLTPPPSQTMRFAPEKGELSG